MSLFRGREKQASKHSEFVQTYIEKETPDMSKALVERVLNPDEKVHTKALQDVQALAISANHVNAVTPGLLQAITNVTQARINRRKVAVRYVLEHDKDETHRKDSIAAVNMAEFKSGIKDEQREITARGQVYDLLEDHEVFKQLASNGLNVNAVIRSADLAAKLSKQDARIHEKGYSGHLEQQRIVMDSQLRGDRQAIIDRRVETVSIPRESDKRERSLLTEATGWFKGIAANLGV